VPCSEESYPNRMNLKIWIETLSDELD